MQTHDIPFASAPFYRAAHHRIDKAWLDNAANAQSARYMLLHKGRPMMIGGERALPETRVGDTIDTPPRELAWLGPQAQTLSNMSQRLFLGLDETDAPLFALNLPSDFNPDNSPIAGLGHFDDMRAAAAMMNGFDAQASSTARSLFEWHRRHGYCANCGAETDIADAGWKRICPACDAEHFPRVDPVAIMLAVHNDKCLLGRQSNWAPGFYSCLAGFIEPGETFEQGAARELHEEAGVVAHGTPEYLFGQPWPFPSSLMIGMIIPVKNNALTIDTNEIESARWFSRDEARAILSGTHADAYAPPPIAVAHHILKAWTER